MSKVAKLHYKVQVWILFRAPSRSAHRWKVLLLKMRKDRGGAWQPVTGSVEKGEAIKDAALREAQEESSLQFHSRPKPLHEKFRFESRWGGECEEHVYYVQAQPGPDGKLPEVTLDPHEHTDYEWMSPSAAEKRLGFASNRRMLRVLRKHLRNLDSK